MDDDNEHNSEGSPPWDLSNNEFQEDLYVLYLFIWVSEYNSYDLSYRSQFHETITPSPNTLSFNTSEEIDQMFKVTSPLFQDKNLVKKGFYDDLPLIRYAITKITINQYSF